MKKIRLEHELYLYQLITEAFGAGRQVFLPKAEELIEAQGLAPADFGQDTWRSVMEASGFVTLTDFKGGRTYITPIRNEEWDAALAQAEQKEEKGKGGKPWKKRKNAKLRAIKPRHIEPKQAEPEAQPEPEPVADDASAEVPETPQTAPEDTRTAPAPEEASAADAAEPEPSQEPEAQASLAEYEPAADAEDGRPHIFTLDEIRALPDEAQEPAGVPEPPAAPEPRTAEAPAPLPAAPAIEAEPSLPRSLPVRFSEEVRCKDELLSMLTRMLPFDIDLRTVLDEDWQQACATGTVEGSRSRVSFPIRFLDGEGGRPIRLTIRRAARPVTGKQWSLVLVDGDDGTGHAHEAVGIEGLPRVDEGAWCDFMPKGSLDTATSPERAFAQFASIGSWDAALGALARTAAPERWQATGSAERYAVLREYLCATYMRAAAQDRIFRDDAAGFAAFDTGLLTAFQEPVYACFVASPASTSPWRLAGFAQAGAGELGQRLVALANPLPEPVSYIASLDDIRPVSGRLVSIDCRGIFTDQLDRLPYAFLAERLEGTPAAEALAACSAPDATPADAAAARIRLARAIASDASSFRQLSRSIDDALEASLARARTSYRWCAPAYVPATDSLRLLVPLALVDDAHIDCALALELMPSGSYQALAVIPLERAYVCARTICSEMPSWLSLA